MRHYLMLSSGGKADAYNQLEITGKLPGKLQAAVSYLIVKQQSEPELTTAIYEVSTLVPRK